MVAEMIVEKSTMHRLSHPQKRVWYTEQLHPQTAVNHIGGCVRIQGDVDFSIMEMAVHSVLQAHEGIRLQLQPQEGEPVQYVASYRKEALPMHNFIEHSDPYAAYEEWVHNESTFKYILYNAPLYHVALFRIGERDAGFLLRAHHIICDGWSMDVLTKHILSLYGVIRARGELNSQRKWSSYLEYLDMEKQYLLSDRCKNNRIYWENKFSLLPGPLFERSAMNVSGRRLIQSLDRENVLNLKGGAARYNVSLPIVLVAAFGLLLSRYYNKDEVVLSMPIANRSAATKTTVGMFTNSVPLRIRVESDMPLHIFLRQVKREYMRNLANHRYPYDLLVRDLQLRKNGLRSLVQASFNYYNTHLQTSLDDALIRNEEFYSGEQAYPVQLMVKDWEDDGTLLFSLDYQTNLISNFEAESLLASMVHLLSEIVSGSDDVSVSSIGLLDRYQWQASVLQFNKQSLHSYAHESTVMDLFENRARENPERIAVSWEGGHLTYNELSEQINRLSFVVADRLSVHSGSVAIRMDHSPWLILSIMAVIKAGAAFIPIALDLPYSRIELMLKDSGATLLMTDDEFAGWGIPVLNVSRLSFQVGSRQLVSPRCRTTDLVYIMYTSGSTGEPKGIKVLHASLANYIIWAASAYLKSVEDIFAFYSSISFDLTLTSLFVPLITGAQLRIYPHNRREHVLSHILNENKVTILKLTPSHLALFPERPNSDTVLHTLIVGGESLRTNLANKIQDLYGTSLAIYNEYGPTETTVGCVVHRFDPMTDREHAVPIGVPVANARLYILDSHMKMLPPGAVGELYISGSGVAEGYLNRQELNLKYFLPDPFEEGAVMYRTGDRVKLGDGYLVHYIGRNDDQVKIRGYRIETAEIEHCLLELQGIREAVVFTRGEHHSVELLAYVVCEKVEFSNIGENISLKLPAYMIPDRMERVSEIPLTINGKPDKIRLAQTVNVQPLYTPTHGGDTEPYTDHLLASIGTVLEKENVRLEDHFFELGGDSIKAIQISSLLKSKGLELGAGTILDYPVINEMRLHLKQDSCHEDQGLAEGEVKPTPIQSWFFAQSFDNPDYYLQSLLLEVDDKLSDREITEGLKRLIRHHDSLRLYYDSERRQLFYNNKFNVDKYQITVLNQSAQREGEQECVLREEVVNFKNKIKLSSIDRLAFQAALIVTPGRKRRLLLTAHHVCVDGISWRVILEDLNRVVNKREALPPKTTSLQRWSNALAERAETVLQSEIGMWQYNGGVLESYTVFGEQRCQRSECLKRVIYFNPEETTRILRGTLGMNVAQVLQIMLALAWHDEFSWEELTIWIENHGREPLFSNLDLSRTVGWFTSLYPVKLSLDSDLGEKKRMEAIRHQLNLVPRKGIGYGILAYTLHQLIPASPGIVFNYLGEFSLHEDGAFRILNDFVGSDIAPSNVFPFQLEINALVINKELQIDFSYSPTLTHERMDRFIDRYKSRLMHIVHEHQSFINEEMSFTPDDFNIVDLTQHEIDALFK